MKRLSVFILTIFILIPGYCQEERMIDQIKKHTTGTAVWWAGHNTWIIKSGNLIMVTDMYIENSGRIEPSPVTPEEIAGVVDISFVTHGHGDHFNEGNSRILLEKSSCLFVIPESCLAIARKLKIPDNRIIIAKPREPLEVKGINVTPIRAIHGNANFAIYYDANLQDCGYLITLEGKTFLQIGDTYLLQDHLKLKHVDVLFFSPTEHNTYIDPSLILINTLDPDYIFPQHHGTVKVTETNRFWTKGYPDEVKIRLSQALKDKYHILKTGDMREIR